MNDRDLARDALTKVPAVTLGFWIIKILATTLGETGGDSVSMSWLGETTADAGEAGLNGYLVGTAIFGALLIVLVWAQVRAKRFNPWLYWGTIAASTTAGTTLADFSTRSLGIGYPGGSLLLFACVMLSLFAWHRTLGTVDINTVATPRAELFYWVTITFLANPRHCAGRLDRRLRTRLRRRCALLRSPAPGARRALFLHEAVPTSSCSGQRSSSRARWEQPSAISWTSRWRTAGSRSADLSQRPRWRSP
jgi:hypothetical protein